MLKDWKVSYKGDVKTIESSEFNHRYNLVNGYCATWGKNLDDDPDFCEAGPLLADIEISTICDGGCPVCYKANTSKGENMSLDTLKKLIAKINPNETLGQVAFGLGMTGEENPELWEMCKWLREQKIIPNGTVANITSETAMKIADNFGACAVSAHTNWKNWKNIFADSVALLSKYGMKQVNCHFVLARETKNELLELLAMKNEDKRLLGLNAIVLLSVKNAGRATPDKFHALTQAEFDEVAAMLMDSHQAIGFDSCTAHKFLDFIKDKPEYKKLETMVEPCESGLFSIYANVKAEIYPCSFNEDEDLKYDVLNRDDFIDYWNGSEWRTRLLQCNRRCPTYAI